jgi:SAM-dependent methyltransferase
MRLAENSRTTPFSFVEPRHVADLASCYFYHVMDLPGLGTVGGQWDLRSDFDSYIGNFPLQNRTVLDIGCASGFLSFEAERRGASVTSFDLDSASRQTLLPIKGSLYFENLEESIRRRDQGFEKWKNAYWLAHRCYGSRARVYYGDIYHLPEELGTFDVVLVGSVLQHLCDPISALASISRRSADTMIITEPVVNTNDPVAYFHGKANDPVHNYTWWSYSLGIYREVLGMLGFTICSVTCAKYTCLLEEASNKIEQTTIITRRTAQDYPATPYGGPAT